MFYRPALGGRLFGNLVTTFWVICTVALSCFAIVPNDCFNKKNSVEWKEKMSATAREQIVDKRGGQAMSPVWQYFGYFKSDKSQTDVVCKLCMVVVSTKSGNTTQLLYHLSRSHLLEYSSVKPPQPLTSASTGGTPHKRQQTTMERYSAAVPYDKTSKEIMDHLVKNLQQLRTDKSEKSGYKNLIHVLDPT